MVGTLKVDTSKLTSTAQVFSETANTVKSLTNEMTETVNSLSGQVWDGDAATKYKNKFTELNDDISRMIGMINEHVTDLNEMAKGYETAEQNNTQVADALMSDVIS